LNARRAPVAALITSTIKNTGKSHDVVYHSAYESADDEPDAATPDSGGDATPTAN